MLWIKTQFIRDIRNGILNYWLHNQNHHNTYFHDCHNNYDLTTTIKTIVSPQEWLPQRPPHPLYSQEPSLSSPWLPPHTCLLPPTSISTILIIAIFTTFTTNTTILSSSLKSNNMQNTNWLPYYSSIDSLTNLFYSFHDISKHYIVLCLSCCCSFHQFSILSYLLNRIKWSC